MNRSVYLLTACVATLGMTAASVIELPTRLVWNPSASTPIGLYTIQPAGHLQRGDIVAMWLPELLAGLVAERGYLPRGVPLLKRVAALPGQVVCRIGAVITVDGAAIGKALSSDHAGRPLPVWGGCVRIADDELFLMNPAVRDSFDGRYFGPVSTCAVIGRATPLYTDATGNGRFVWRARRMPDGADVPPTAASRSLP